MLRVVAVLTFSVFTAFGCHYPASVGMHENTYLKPDTKQRCVSLCSQTGMVLDSLVIMASRVGCVCRAAAADTAPAPASEGAPQTTPTPASQGAPATSSAAGTAGGMAAVLLDEAAAADDSKPAQPTVQPATPK